MAEIKKYWQNYAWIIVLFTAVSLVGGIFMHMSATYATIRELERSTEVTEKEVCRVDQQVVVINHTLKEVTKTLFNLKTLITLMNTNFNDRLDKLDQRLNRIDDRLSRLEGLFMGEPVTKKNRE